MKKYITLLALFVGIFSSKGQDVLINSTNNGQTFIGCSRNIYDSGGSGGNYGNNQDYSVSFTSNSASLPGIALIFTQDIDIDATDTLWIYDGDGTSPSQLFRGGPNNETYFNASNKILADDHFQMSILNTSHKITIRFKSNSATVGTGFKIALSCSKLCQSLYSRFDIALTNPQPDTNYIALCPWDTATIVAHGYYPMSDTMTTPFYHQSDLTSTFNWNFGDGTTASGVGLTTVNHYFDPGRGYDIMLTIIDSNGCQNNNAFGVRVMTSLNPLTSIDPLPDICSGTSFFVNVGYSNSSTIHIEPIVSEQISFQLFDSTTFIPDGICNGSACYNTFVTFNSFNPGQTIQSVNDILSVCIKMEHSFIGDLHFELVCPNGQIAKLMNTTGPGQHGGANFGTQVGTSDAGDDCDPSTNPPGIGWNYCWSEQPSYTYHGTLDALSGGSSPIDSTNRANHSNFIVPEQSFSNLIGCPLNGTWNIKICDLYPVDNGYVFEWSLELDPSLVPQAWTYDVGINNIIWSGPFLTTTNDTTAQINSTIDANGSYDYTFTIIDRFGCGYDSAMVLKVVQTPTPNLGNDTSFCNDGTILILDPHYGIAGTSYNWSDFTNDPTLPVLMPNTYMLTVTNANSNIQCKGFDTITVQYFPQPTVGFTATPVQGCSPLLVSFSDASTPTGINYTYAWDFGDPSAQVNTSNEQNPQHLYNQYGNFDVSLLITTPDGCSSTITKPGLISVYPTPEAHFTPNPANASLSDNPTVVFTNSTENFILAETSWFWNFQDGATSTDMNSSHTYTAPGDYNVYLVARNSHGCVDSVFHVVVVEDELFIPNILTPDGDNNNDFLVIGNLNTNRDNVLKVYDRWGKKVYEKKNYNTTSLCQKLDPEGKTWQCGAIANGDQGWNGEGCADGVYYYSFHYEGVIKTVDKHGTITIVGSK